MQQTQLHSYSHSVPNGKSLENCEKLTITKYDTIQSQLPEKRFDDLRADQKHLYEIKMSVNSGKC